MDNTDYDDLIDVCINAIEDEQQLLENWSVFPKTCKYYNHSDTPISITKQMAHNVRLQKIYPPKGHIWKQPFYVKLVIAQRTKDIRR